MADMKEFSTTVSFWVGQIDNYEMQFQPWEKRSKKIIDRYRDERKGAKTKARFNLLWSNVQTLHPAIYDTPPKVNIDGRQKNDSDLTRYTALVLERAASYYVGHDIFDDVMKQATLDRLLSGRGTAWIRYIPTFQDVEQITDDASMQSEDGVDEPDQELYSEDTTPDYVHWQDFGHTWARTWQEVRGVWRKVYLSRAELVKRFGKEIGSIIPLDAKPRSDDGKETETGKKASVYEIWDKTKKQALWIHKDHPEPLDEKDDPLKLKDFFPCPKPIYATLTNDDLIPTPDYIQYQDQAQELDALTGRIESITKALKVAGVYASDAEGIDRLLSEGVENKLLPVSQWAAFAEKGGLAGIFSLMPMQEILIVLQGLYQSREQVKQAIYEITGISDIIRGASNPNETLGAQELKGQYAGLRLGSMQKDVARFARDMVRIMTEIIAEHFSMDTIKQVCGIELLTEVEKQQLQMMQQQMQAQSQQQPMEGQPPPPPPQIPEEIQDKMKLLDLPTWEEIEAVIRNDMVRCFAIDIETDSTIKQDQEAEKASRNEFLASAGGFIQQMQTVQNPELQPLLMEMLMFGVRGFKVSRELETTFDNVLDKMKKQIENPAPAQPDPAIQAEQAKMQMEQGKLQASAQSEQMKLQSSQQTEQLKAQIETKKIDTDAQIKQQELQIKGREVSLKEQETQAKIRQENLNMELEKMRISLEMIRAQKENTAEGEVTEDIDANADIVNILNQGMMAIAQAQAESNNAVIQAIQNPPPREVVRDSNGNIAGVR
jgi:hypothetical protein